MSFTSAQTFPEKITQSALPSPAVEISSALEVYFGEKLYYIPLVYLPTVTPLNSTRTHAAFTINIILPDFTPAAYEKQNS